MLPPRADAVIGLMIFRRILAGYVRSHTARPVRGGPGSIVVPAAADGGRDVGEFGRLLNSGKIEDLRKIAETHDEESSLGRLTQPAAQTRTPRPS